MAEILGKVTWTYHGPWSPDTPYGPLSVVYHKGSSWVSKKATQNEEPAVMSTSWGLVALGYSLVSNFTVQDGQGAQIQRQILQFGEGFTITDLPVQGIIKIESSGSGGGAISTHSHDGVNSQKISYTNLLNTPLPHAYSVGSLPESPLPRLLKFAGEYWQITPSGDQVEIGINLSTMVNEHSRLETLISGLDQKIKNLPSTLQLTIANISNFPTMMTPTAHAVSHRTGQPDAISPTDIGAIPIDGLISDTKAIFTTASQREVMDSEQKMSVNLGRANAYFRDLKNIAFTGKYIDLTGAPEPHTYAVGAGSESALPKKLVFDGQYWTITPTAGQIKIAVNASALTAEDNRLAGLINSLEQRVNNLPATLQLTTANITNFPTTMTPSSHAQSHSSSGDDPITIVKSQISDFPTSMPAVAHASSHYAGGNDVITPTDIGAMAARPNAIEMRGWAGGGGLIDFHFDDDTTVEFTSRIGEFAKGVITFAPHVHVTGNLIISGLFYINNKEIPLSDTGRIALSIATGWTAGNPLPVVRKIGKLVELGGLVKVVGSPTDGAIITTLPASCRPTFKKHFLTYAYPGWASVRVEPNGAVYYKSIPGSTPGNIVLDGVMFHIN